MTSDYCTGSKAPFVRWICIAALLSSFSACGSGNSEIPQAVGSDGDRVEASPPPVIEPQPNPTPGQCNVDHPDGNEIVLLAGQSNANEGLLAAIDETLTTQGVSHWLGHHYAGGNEIASWMREDGTPGLLWPRMINAFDAAIGQATEAGKPISALTFVWFQGESDIFEHNRGQYEARLRQLIDAVETHAESNWTGTPKPVFSIAQPHNKIPKAGFGIDVVRASIATIADDLDNVCAFDTRDIERVDHVHLPNPVTEGSPEQLIAAERALACARVVVANRCDSKDSGQ